MSVRLTDGQLGHRDRAREFAAASITPWAGEIDQRQSTPEHVLAAMRSSGYLGAALPERWGGGGLDPVSYGLVTEEIGRACSSVRSLMTVHNMAAQAIFRAGDPDQRAELLPRLCTGEQLIAFALTEPNAGSSVDVLETEAVPHGGGYRVNGVKKWTTYGQIADLFLVLAHCDHRPIALVVDRHSDGLTVTPVRDLLGTRGSMPAELRLDDVVVPAARRLGPAGTGTGFVAHTALDHGRASVAWGSTGIIQACLDACVSYTRQRRQGGHALKDYQLVRRHLTDMLVAYTAARALCHRSACLRQDGDPRAVMETSMAKYFAAGAALRAATDAVHLHGANGCGPDYPVGRYLRDATVMGIVEGTAEIHQISLANYAFQRPYRD
ncbi:acyl-CoA dehydrogenase family protein [Actinoplanes sp. NPDC049599]|uniref:acyl-CoA dehydrogenase family protein n=1 Tax=Actinoplanes sp. NPDC049599 TaxID=3363903 RepID=UPI00378C5C98